MRRLLITMMVAAIASSLAVAGCSQAAAPAPSQPSPAPASQAAPAPTKAAEATKPAPTKAAEPAKADAPAKTGAFPEKGKTISLIVGYAAGGGADIGARVLATPLEKELGVPVQVVNKPGAGTQISTAFVAQSKPDGYTVGYSNWPNMITVYMDPERKATYGRKDLQPVAMHLNDPMAIAVKADGPYKDLKDLLAAAKAKPKEIKIGTTGKLAIEHLVFLKLQEEVGVKFTFVHFDGTAPAIAALLGDNLDAVGGGFSSMLPTAKGGQTRILASMDKGGDAFLPGTKSLEDFGYKGYFGVSRGWFVPAGTPKEVVTALSNGIKKAMDTPEHKSKITEIGQMPMYMDPDQMATYWDSQDSWVKPIMALAAKDN